MVINWRPRVRKQIRRASRDKVTVCWFPKRNQDGWPLIHIPLTHGARGAKRDWLERNQLRPAPARCGGQFRYTLGDYTRVILQASKPGRWAVKTTRQL